MFPHTALTPHQAVALGGFLEGDCEEAEEETFSTHFTCTDPQIIKILDVIWNQYRIYFRNYSGLMKNSNSFMNENYYMNWHDVIHMESMIFRKTLDVPRLNLTVNGV